MFPLNNPFNIFDSWTKFANAYAQMSMASAEVIVRRTMMMSQGTMSGPEAMGMVLEKATAFAASAEGAAVAAATGADLPRIASAALKPIHAKARSNARKLRG
jgi:hypothetical protein